MKIKKAVIVLSILVAVLVLLYALLWLSSSKKYDVEYGISFNQNQAQFLELDWQETYTAMLKDLKPKYIRIAAMWSEVEKEKKVYDFADVDWMMDKAEEYNAKVTLVVGQKAPRWPECHVPGWLESYSDSEAEEHLFDYISEVVSRYQDHPALEIWQVENEPFIRFRFGECDGFREDLVVEEVELVKKLDNNYHPIIITDSGELSTWRQASKLGDLFGTTLYRIVRTPGGSIFTYDWLPPAFYRLKAKFWNMPIGEVYVSELQAEPWFADSSALGTAIAEQEQTMSKDRLKAHLDYVERIGVSRAYLWGVEWWYWMKTEAGDSGYWDLLRDLNFE